MAWNGCDTQQLIEVWVLVGSGTISDDNSWLSLSLLFSFAVCPKVTIGIQTKQNSKVYVLCASVLGPTTGNQPQTVMFDWQFAIQVCQYNINSFFSPSQTNIQFVICSPLKLLDIFLFFSSLSLSLSLSLSPIASFDNGKGICWKMKNIQYFCCLVVGYTFGGSYLVIYWELLFFRLKYFKNSENDEFLIGTVSNTRPIGVLRAVWAKTTTIEPISCTLLSLISFYFAFWVGRW